MLTTLAAAMALSAGAQASTPPPQPPPVALPMMRAAPQHRQMDFLEGRWTCEFDYIIGRERRRFAGTATGAWAPQGLWFIRTFEYDAPVLGPMWGHESFAFDAAANGWVRNVFDNQSPNVVGQTGAAEPSGRLMFRGEQVNGRGMTVPFETRYTPTPDGYEVRYFNLVRADAPIDIGAEYCRRA